MPLDQIVLGVAAYGHSFRVATKDAFVPGTDNLALYPPFNASDIPVGDSWDDGAGLDECGNPQGPGGDIDFWGLIQQGYLSSTGKPVATVPYIFDSCTQTVSEHVSIVVFLTICSRMYITRLPTS